MSDNPPSNLYDFAVSGRTRVISYVSTKHVSEGVESDIYTFVDDPLRLLTVYTVAPGIKTLLRKVVAGHRVIEGYVKGKGTLTVSSASGAKDTYYFEKDGHTKDVIVESGQTLQWIAPNDAELVYYEVTPLPRPVTHPRAAVIAKPTGPRLRLLLTSLALSNEQSRELVKLVGKPAQDIKIALIENAADVEPEPKPWVAQNQEAIKSHGFNVEVVDLRKYTHDHVGLLQQLQRKDVIWLGGGNSFYLRWLLSATRADDIIKRLVHRGVVYGGAGAGAIVAGPTLKYFEAIDDQSKAPLTTEGLNLVNAAVVPHMDSPKLKHIMIELNQKLLGHHFKTLALKDSQALIIDGNTQRII
jgi:dipeptidase E